MNTVTISLIPYGPHILSYRSAACSFLDNVIIAIERLERLGYSFTLDDMGKKFFINVR
jgi:hypothetical protein